MIVAEKAETEVLEAVMAEPGLNLSRLLQQLNTAGSDDVYIMLVKGQIYVDLEAYPLAEPEQASVFRDQWSAEAHIIIPDTLAEAPVTGVQNIQIAVGELLSWAGSPWRIINFTETQLWLRFEREGEQHKMVKLNLAEFKHFSMCL
ncbi:MAG: hypothetical protein KDI79_06670 [Anaerolineae bacterium]|nr:hypothetical protein [Anaerolineae bacterium]